MTKQEFINWAKSKGWTEDKWGHLQKEIKPLSIGEKYRFKLGSISVRYEKKIEVGIKQTEWLRLRSGYFKDLNTTPEGRLTGLKR